MWVRLRDEIYDLSKCTSILVDTAGCTLRFGHPGEKLTVGLGDISKRDPKVIAFYEAVKAYAEQMCPVAPKSDIYQEIISELVNSQFTHEEYRNALQAVITDPKLLLRQRAVKCAAWALAAIEKFDRVESKINYPRKGIYADALVVNSIKNATEACLIDKIKYLTAKGREGSFRMLMLKIMGQCIQAITEIDDYALR